MTSPSVEPLFGAGWLAARWTVENPVLPVGWIGQETDTLKAKVGDGSTAWNALDYFTGAGGVSPSGTSVAPAWVNVPVSTVEGDWNNTAGAWVFNGDGTVTGTTDGGVMSLPLADSALSVLLGCCMKVAITDGAIGDEVFCLVGTDMNNGLGGTYGSGLHIYRASGGMRSYVHVGDGAANSADVATAFGAHVHRGVLQDDALATVDDELRCSVGGALVNPSNGNTPTEAYLLVNNYGATDTVTVDLASIRILIATPPTFPA